MSALEKCELIAGLRVKVPGGSTYSLITEGKNVYNGRVYWNVIREGDGLITRISRVQLLRGYVRVDITPQFASRKVI